MKEIERYIQFAIDNGYDLLDSNNEVGADFWRDIKSDLSKGSEIIKYAILNVISVKVITSKEFIEAIAKGLLKTKNGSYVYLKYGFIILPRNKENEWANIISDRITKDQAIAIRDNTLDEFINNILPKGT